MSQVFVAGDKVFAKLRGYPPWPARVEGIANSSPINRKYHVLFYGTMERGVCTDDNLFPYVENKEKYGRRIKRNGFKKALEQIEGLAPVPQLVPNIDDIVLESGAKQLTASVILSIKDSSIDKNNHSDEKMKGVKDNLKLGEETVDSPVSNGDVSSTFSPDAIQDYENQHECNINNTIGCESFPNQTTKLRNPTFLFNEVSSPKSDGGITSTSTDVHSNECQLCDTSNTTSESSEGQLTISERITSLLDKVSHPICDRDVSSTFSSDDSHRCDVNNTASFGSPRNQSSKPQEPIIPFESLSSGIKNNSSNPTLKKIKRKQKESCRNTPTSTSVSNLPSGELHKESTNQTIICKEKSGLYINCNQPPPDSSIDSLNSQEKCSPSNLEKTVSRSGRVIKRKAFVDDNIEVSKKRKMFKPCRESNRQKKKSVQLDESQCVVVDNVEVSKERKMFKPCRESNRQKKKSVQLDESQCVVEKTKAKPRTVRKQSSHIWLATENMLMKLDTVIKAQVGRSNAHPEKCLHYMDELLGLKLHPLMLRKHPEVVETMKRLRRYVGNAKQWNLSEEEQKQFADQASLIRSKAEMIFDKFKILFSSPDISSFLNVFADSVIEFQEQTRNWPMSKINTLVSEPKIKVKPSSVNVKKRSIPSSSNLESTAAAAHVEVDASSPSDNTITTNLSESLNDNLTNLPTSVENNSDNSSRSENPENISLAEKGQVFNSPTNVKTKHDSSSKKNESLTTENRNRRSSIIANIFST